MSPAACAFCGSAERPGSPGAETARLIIDSLRAGALAGGPDGHICDANACAAQILRIPLDELQRSHISDILAPLDRLRGQGGSDRVELTVRLRDGHQAVLGCSLSEVKGERGNGWVLLFQEISGVVELRRRHDRLLQLAAVGDSLPSVLHEIRNPLAAVTSMLEVLVEEAEGSHQEDLHAVLWELRRIVLTLQGIGGLHSDLTTKSHEAVDVAIREACRVMSTTAERRGVNVRWEVPDFPLLPLKAAVLRGIVFNLVRNAIDACGDRGEVLLRAELAPDSKGLTVSVRDNGCGMTDEELSRCCDIFFTTKEHGSGIGLPICKEVVDRAGGSLQIRSQRGEGTQVTVTVPIEVRSKSG